MARSIVWSPELETELTLCWEGGASIGEIAAKFGISPKAIRCKARRLDLSLRRKKGLAQFWINGRNDEFVAMWSAGIPVPEIANHFGVSRQAIHVRRYTLRLPRRNKPVSWWLLDDRLTRMKAFWFAGMAASEIALRLGCTRNAVCGKVMRLGLGPKLKIPNIMKREKRRARRHYSIKPAAIAGSHTSGTAINMTRRKKPAAENKADKERCLRLGHSKTSAPYRRFQELGHPQHEKTKAQLRAELTQAILNTAALQ